MALLAELILLALLLGSSYLVKSAPADQSLAVTALLPFAKQVSNPAQLHKLREPVTVADKIWKHSGLHEVWGKRGDREGNQYLPNDTH